MNHVLLKRLGVAMLIVSTVALVIGWVTVTLLVQQLSAASLLAGMVVYVLGEDNPYV